MEYVFPILIVAALVIGTPIVAIVALVRSGGLREQNERLAREVAQLRQRIDQMREMSPLAREVARLRERIDQRELASLAPAVVHPTSSAPIEPPLSKAEAVVEPVAESVPPLPPAFEPTESPPLPPVPEETPPLPPSWDPPPAAAPTIGWEQRLGARAFIWVGAITLALAALFLVRYSIEEGYLSPEVRVILAALFGFGLIAGAEKIRARDERVAQALAAAGVASLYGALFSAVALYGMISRPAAGAGASALTAFAIGLSLRHGVFVAALAFVGGFAGPAIIGSDAPNTPVLFGYLLAIAVGTLAVIRHRGWWLLGWGVLAGSVLWTVAWMFTDAGGMPWVGLFLVAVAGLFVWATWRRLEESETQLDDVVALVWTALGVTGGLLVALIELDGGRQDAGWLALAVHGAGAYALARWTPRFQYVAVLAPLLSLAALALWSLHWTQGAFDDVRFAWVTTVFGVLYAAGAFALMWNAGRPGFWAALSVAAALTHFLWCWYVLRIVDAGTPWGLISVGLAAPFLVGAERLTHWRARMAGATEALGYLAAGVSFFIALAIPLELDREWITVGYALELAAVAAIAFHLELMTMRRICWGLLAVVVVRFVLNPEILKYPLGVTPVFNWILWGYGLSIAALVVGRHYLLKMRDDRLILGVEVTIALLIFALVTLEARSLFQRGAMDAPRASFMERAVYVLIWGGFALVSLWVARWRRDVVALWAWRLSGLLALGTVLIVQVLVGNPIVEKADVGSLPILNGLLLAYAVPAAMAAVGRRWMETEDREYRLLAGLAASVLAFVYVSMEVRHFFDPDFARRGLGAAGVELYAYSFVWLLFGVGLLALGFVRHAAALRHAGMVLVCIVVAKVFLIDMAGLQGLLRVVSFLGLGAALLGLGYAYRRFGFDQAQQGTK